jgi:hypothetical protein
MDILEAITIELRCAACGGRYEISLNQVMVSRHMLHEGCPVPEQFTTECPPLNFADLLDHALIHELRRTWLQLEVSAQAAGGKLLLRGDG